LSGWSLHLDEDNHDHDLAEALRRSGLETHRSGDHGMDATSDEDQLEFAAAHAFVLYTSNLRDYERLHRERLETGLTHAGIIFRPSRRWSVGEQARRILRIWEALSAEEMVNRIESLSLWGEEPE
jgi:hypothetical protein